jgi:hypothetical protein
MQSGLMLPKFPSQNSLKFTAGFREASHPGAPGAADTSKLVEALKQSRFYREYGEAFTKMTGLPLSLIPANPLPSGPRRDPPLNARSHAASLTRSPAYRGWAADTAISAPANSQSAPADPCFTIVPVTVKNRVIGYLRTGLMLGEEPTPENFDRFIRAAAGRGAAADREMLKRAYFSAAVLTGQTHESAVRLLSFLAQHLGMLSI